jgi:predicted dehydrogenase
VSGRAVRLAVLGCGWIAQNRLRQIAPDGLVDVVLLTDPSDEACAAVLREAPNARVERDLRALTPDRVDAVMISTPTGLHADQAVALLEQGLPVFVQKPLGISVAEVARVLDAAARNNLPVDTDFCYRDLASARALREEFLGGAVGRAYYVEACFHNAYRPSARWSVDPRLAGGGALMDLGIHLIDLVGWITGQGAVLRDVHLRQRGRPLAHAEIEDFAKVALCLDDGAEVQIVTTWDAAIGRDARIRLTVYGEDGNLELTNRAGSFFHFDARRCVGTRVDQLASDDSDQWQAGPLRDWLQRVRQPDGHKEPEGIRHVAAIIDSAYALGRPAFRGEPAARALEIAVPPEVFSHGVHS